jgi:hypothetical protein
MQIMKINNPGMAYMLLSWYLDIWEPIEKTCCRLYEMMTEEPESTLLCVAVEDDKIQGIAIAYTEVNDCVIWQMNATDAKQFDEPISFWAKKNKCERLVVHTHRNPEALSRRHGFELDKTDKVNNITRHTMSRAI